jgi:hypothetical protein
MNQEARLDPAPRGVTTLDLLLITAGFACGWVMYRRSAVCVSRNDDLPLSAGWMTFFAVTTAVLAVLGPMRLAEATSAEYPGYPIDLHGGSLVTVKPWRWQWLTVYLELRAWGGHSLRALALMTLGFPATGSFVKRWRSWLWTEWAAFASAVIIAACWLYGELVVRPALDRTARVVFLCAWILVLAATAGGGIWAWSRIERRFRRRDGTGEVR